jgi:hypothetical protein
VCPRGPCRTTCVLNCVEDGMAGSRVTVYVDIDVPHGEELVAGVVKEDSRHRW